ncbi:MAG: tyrosine-type recombinase/integrase [Pseudomonadota bacterium]
MGKLTGITPDGAGLRIRLWKNGKLAHSETLKGDPTSSSLQSAAKARREWLQSRLKLGLPLTLGEKQSDLFEDLAQGYLNTLDAKYSTHITYENILNRYWMPLFTGRPAKEITRREIREALAGFNVSNKTRKNIKAPLSGVFDHGDINPNPCAGIKLKKRDSTSPESYEPAQRDALLLRIGDKPVSDWFKGQPIAYFALLFGCGLRPCGEPLALQWSDYDGEWLSVTKQITKRRLQNYTKTDVRRRVWVPTWVRPHLDHLQTRFGGGYIFQNSLGGPHLDTDHFNPIWQWAHERARIPYQEPYAARHTRASELLSTGVDPADAAKQLGHSPEMFLRVYAEWVEKFRKDLEPTRFEGVTAEIRHSRRSSFSK